MGDEYLTMAEIEAKYPGEWVLLDRPTKDRHGDVTGGRLVFHQADRGLLDAELLSRHLREFAVLHVYDPNAEPVYLITPWFEEEWTDDSTPAGGSSSSPPS
ncbi:MAG TPA: hypothetical protein VFG68_15450 [Fimbriiglobus sp.]|nr:hypothetical protein [Fimbriiglobus sp.]